MKNLCVVLLCLMLLVGFVHHAIGEERKASLSFATSGQGGTFYVAGTGIASLVSKEVEGLQLTAEVTKGVVENARLMASNQTEMGFSYGSTAYNISRGLAPFEGQKYEGLCQYSIFLLLSIE